MLSPTNAVELFYVGVPRAAFRGAFLPKEAP